MTTRRQDPIRPLDLTEEDPWVRIRATLLADDKGAMELELADITLRQSKARHVLRFLLQPPRAPSESA